MLLFEAILLGILTQEKIRLMLAFKEYNKNNKASICRQTAILNITLDASTKW